MNSQLIVPVVACTLLPPKYNYPGKCVLARSSIGLSHWSCAMRSCMHACKLLRESPSLLHIWISYFDMHVVHSSLEKESAGKVQGSVEVVYTLSIVLLRHDIVPSIDGFQYFLLWISSPNTPEVSSNHAWKSTSQFFSSPPSHAWLLINMSKKSHYK